MISDRVRSWLYWRERFDTACQRAANEHFPTIKLPPPSNETPPAPCPDCFKQLFGVYTVGLDRGVHQPGCPQASFTDQRDELCRLRRIVENQEQNLASWRRGADEDAGKLQRMHNALFRIAHGFDSLDEVREIARKEL